MIMKHLFILLLFYIVPTIGYSGTTTAKSLLKNNNVSIEEQNDAEVLSSNHQISGLHSAGFKQGEFTRENEFTKWQIVISLISILVPIFVSWHVKRKSDKVLKEVNMRDMRLRTSNIVLSKRLEVFPKLHIQTDKLGATIRYYKKHRNIIELKKGLKVFFTQLADWDAKYCIFAGLEVTKSIAVLRRKLEEEDSWVEANNSTIISDNDVEWLYHKLQDLEKALKEEMAVFFTSFEDEGEKRNRRII